MSLYIAQAMEALYFARKSRIEGTLSNKYPRPYLSNSARIRWWFRKKAWTGTMPGIVWCSQGGQSNSTTGEAQVLSSFMIFWKPTSTIILKDVTQHSVKKRGLLGKYHKLHHTFKEYSGSSKSSCMSYSLKAASLRWDFWKHGKRSKNSPDWLRDCKTTVLRLGFPQRSVCRKHFG